MAGKKLNLTIEDLAQPFQGEWGRLYPPVLTLCQLAELIGRSEKTIYFWIAKGRLDGSFRKRGKHHFFWRDRALNLLFNGSDWPIERGSKKESPNQKRENEAVPPVSAELKTEVVLPDSAEPTQLDIH